jgi:alkylated DNA repair dioxygenase AlkB
MPIVSQLPLFASPTETRLLDEGRGRVTYLPGFVPDEVALAWFAELRDAVPWKAQRRHMYDREVDVPRLQAQVELWAGDEPILGAIRAAADRVIAATGVPFTSVGLNFYRDGADSVAPHSDLDDIVRGSPVALLSLGATRRMTIRAKRPPARSIHVDLAGGSLLVMNYESQLHYTHGVPKTPARVGPRISLALRVRPRGA